MAAAALHALLIWTLSSGAGLEHRTLGGRHVWAGVWMAGDSDFYQVAIDTASDASLDVGGRIVARIAPAELSENPRVVWIEAGVHDVRAEVDERASATGVPFRIARVGEPLAPFETLDLRPAAPAFPPGHRWMRAASDLARLVALAGLAALAAFAAARLQPRLTAIAARPLGPRGWTVRQVAGVAAVALVVAYGALLRFDAIALKYGPVREPGWLRALQESRAPDSILRPAGVTWSPVTGRYISDPYTYLIFAREMRQFYEASPREPVFPFATRAFLALLDDQDVAVSFASGAFSALAILGTFLLGAAAFGYGAGLVAAGALAIEHTAITWGTGGWRDDAFMCGVVFAAYAMLRYARSPSRGNAIALGIVCGLACLVRITSLSFVLPGLLWLFVTQPGPWRARIRGIALAGVTTAVIVSPFLVNCWLKYGDPLYAINIHADVYRIAGGESVVRSQTAADYVRSRAIERPVDTLDTFARGMTSYPFLNKWDGFRPWADSLGSWLKIASLLGLVLSVATPAGRLLLIVLAASLVPYSLTWKLGSDWRFTEHAYPFLLVAAPAGILLVVRFIGRIAAPGRWRPSRRIVIGWAIWSAGLAAGVWTVTRVLPVLAVGESIAAGEEVSIAAGPRDGWYFVGGWSKPLAGGNVTFRVTDGPHPRMRLFLPRVQAYRLTLRADPFPRPLTVPTPPSAFELLINGQPLTALSIGFDQNRVGAYDVDLPASMVRQGVNHLTLRSRGDSRLSVWYLRVRPERLEPGRPPPGSHP